jgi:hypothetical protein
MARGVAADIGEERWSKNGYLYRKTARGWELVHRLVAEEKLGRRLTDNEYAAFADGDRTNLNPSNVVVKQRGRTSIRRRIAQVDARLAELSAVKQRLEDRLEAQEAL